MQITYLTGIPYYVILSDIEDGVLACMPTLGESLFRAVGNTKEEACEILSSIYDTTVEWYLENVGPLPPPN